MELFMRMLRNIGLTLIVVVLILIFFNSVFKQVPQITDSVECEQEITQHIQLRKLSDKLVPPPKCPTQIISLDTDDEEEVKEVMAEAARSCFRTWREGNESFFAGEGTFCHVCSLVEIEKDVEINDFDNYLLRTYMSGTELSYGQYFSKQLLEENNQEEFNALFRQTVTFDTNTPISLVYQQITGWRDIRKFLERDYPQQVIVMGSGEVYLTEHHFFGDEVIGSQDIIFAQVNDEQKILLTSGVNIPEDDYMREIRLITIQPYTPDSLAQMGCQLPSKSFS